MVLKNNTVIFFKKKVKLKKGFLTIAVESLPVGSSRLETELGAAKDIKAYRGRASRIK